MCSLKALSEMMYLPHQSQLKCVIIKGFYPEFVLKWWYFQIAGLNRCKVTSDVFFGFSLLWAFKCSLKLPACLRNHMHLTFHRCVLSNVSSNRLHESMLVAFDYSPLCVFECVQGPWQKVLTDLKKSLYTLQADPEKSRDFKIKNPGILINWKSRDPGIPGIPLGPASRTCNNLVWTVWTVWKRSDSS